MGDDEALIAAERARRRAMEADDVEALEALTADFFHYAHINGMVEDRTTYLDRIRARVVKTHATSANDLTIVRRDGYALLMGKSRIEYEWAAGDRKGVVETLFTSVWEPHEEGWKIVAYASTPLPQ